MSALENCNASGCQNAIKRGDGARCGGLLFGVRDDGVGCGRFFCGDHLVGHRGPFFCRACWERRDGRRENKLANEVLDAIDACVQARCELRTPCGPNDGGSAQGRLDEARAALVRAIRGCSRDA